MQTLIAAAVAVAVYGETSDPASDRSLLSMVEEVANALTERSMVGQHSEQREREWGHRVLGGKHRHSPHNHFKCVWDGTKTSGQSSSSNSGCEKSGWKFYTAFNKFGAYKKKCACPPGRKPHFEKGTWGTGQWQTMRIEKCDHHRYLWDKDDDYSAMDDGCLECMGAIETTTALLSSMGNDDLNMLKDSGQSCSTPTPTPSCMAADTEMKTKSRGIVPASDVYVGELVEGEKDGKKQWCTVVANANSGSGFIQGNFTPDHVLVGDTSKDLFVGMNGTGRIGNLVNMVTDCDVAMTSSGQRFTPFSTAFCPGDANLTWSNYLSVMNSARELTKTTAVNSSDSLGFLWDPRQWKDNESHPLRPALHQLCLGIVECAEKETCKNFEDATEELLDSNLNNQSKKEVILSVWNGTKQMSEKIIYANRYIYKPTTAQHISLLVIGGVTGGLLVALIALWFRRKLPKKSTRNMSQWNISKSTRGMLNNMLSPKQIAEFEKRRDSQSNKPEPTDNTTVVVKETNGQAVL